MKRVALIALFSLLYAESILDEVTRIERFKPVFKSIRYYNVFEYEAKANVEKKDIVPIPKRESVKLNIYAIFQDRVNINGKWLKVGDIMKGYKVVKITNKHVYLRRDNDRLKLSITNYILKEKE